MSADYFMEIPELIVDRETIRQQYEFVKDDSFKGIATRKYPPYGVEPNSFQLRHIDVRNMNGIKEIVHRLKITPKFVSFIRTPAGKTSPLHTDNRLSGLNIVIQGEGSLLRLHKASVPPGTVVFEDSEVIFETSSVGPFIFDTRFVHSVKNPSSEDRVIISMVIDISYEELVAMYKSGKLV